MVPVESGLYSQQISEIRPILIEKKRILLLKQVVLIVRVVLIYLEWSL